MLTDSTISLLRSHDVGPQTHRETKSVQIFASEIDVISVRFELDQLSAACDEVTCLDQSLESVEYVHGLMAATAIRLIHEMQQRDASYSLAGKLKKIKRSWSLAIQDLVVVVARTNEVLADLRRPRNGRQNHARLKSHRIYSSWS
jgi:hypothetical protein